MKKKLSDLADILRSKNAGPYTLTVDFLFNDKGVYETVKSSGSLDEKEIAGYYKVNPESVKIYYYDKASGIKVTIQEEYHQEAVVTRTSMALSSICRSWILP